MMERGERARAHGCQVDKDKYHTWQIFLYCASGKLCFEDYVSISGNPVVLLCGQIKHLNCVLIFKLSAVHCCTRATISIQGKLYRYSYHQINVSNRALLFTYVILSKMVLQGDVEETLLN